MSDNIPIIVGEVTVGDAIALAASIEASAAALPSEPATLLRLSEIFQDHGHPKTAALLRHCADQVMSRPIPVGFPVTVHSIWRRLDGGTGATISIPALAIELVGQGKAMRLCPVPAVPAEADA